MRHIWMTAAALSPAACALGAESESWTRNSWAAQTIREIASGPFSFSASPYGDDGFKLKLTIKTGAVGISSANESVIGTSPDETQLRRAAEAAAPQGCTLAGIEMAEDGGALATYACE